MKGAGYDSLKKAAEPDERAGDSAKLLAVRQEIAVSEAMLGKVDSLNRAGDGGSVEQIKQDREQIVAYGTVQGRAEAIAELAEAQLAATAASTSPAGDAFGPPGGEPDTENDGAI